MSYSYSTERQNLFTEQGQIDFLKVRDRVKHLLDEAGAFTAGKVIGLAGSTWLGMACLDRMVELGELEKLPRNCWAQYEVYASPEKHNR